jgi:hypothetical protein
VVFTFLDCPPAAVIAPKLLVPPVAPELLLGLIPPAPIIMDMAVLSETENPVDV